MDGTTSDTECAVVFEDFLRRDMVLHGLPSQAYTSHSFLELECQRLFPNHWMFVGFAHELQKPGDVVPITAAGRPILLMRNTAGDINAFHNVCRHRCTKLVEHPGNVGRSLRCPYHSWIYGLDGELRSAPFFGGRNNTPPPGFDRSEHGLVSIRTAVWHDWIFININCQAENFADFIAPIERRFEDIDLTDLKLVAVLDFGEVDTNWKFLMENFIEPYHVPVVHSHSTDQPLFNHVTVIDGHCLGSSVDVTKSSQSQVGSNILAVSSRYLTLFPNFVLGRYFPDQIGVHLNLPISPGKTSQRRAIYMSNGEVLDAECADALKQLWSRVHVEDHEMCERAYRGRASEVSETGGVLSPYWEDSLRCFQELVVHAVQPSNHK